MTEKTAVPVKRGEQAAHKWDPFTQFRELQDEMDRLWGTFWPFSLRPATMPTFRWLPSETAWAPRMDVYKKNGNLVIKAELPGLKPEDVDVSYEEGDLIVKGERKAEKEVKEQDYYRMERSYGSFYRRQPLPEGITPEQIKATFADGILEITIPAPTQAKTEAHKIAVETK